MMLMNGLKMKRLKQKSISKMMTKSGLSKVGVLIVFLFLSGCGDRGWTVYQYENRSEEEIKVTIRGINPDPSVGRLLPGDGADQLTEMSRHYGEPIRVAETITIEWTNNEGENKRSQELKRSDLKLPATVIGGEIRFIYSAEGKWSIKYKYGELKVSDSF